MFQCGCFEAAGKSGFWKPCLGRTLQHLICHQVSTQLIWVQWECWMNILQHNFLFLFVRPWRKKVAELLCNLQLERLHLSWPRSLKPSTAHKENSAAVWWQDDQCFHRFHQVPMDWIWSLSIRLKGVRDDLSTIEQWVVLHSRWVISAWKRHSLHFAYKGPAFASSPSKALGHQVIWKSNTHHHVTAWSMPGWWDRLYGFARHMTWGNQEICRCFVDVLHSGKAKHPLLGLTKRTELHSIGLSFSV